MSEGFTLDKTDSTRKVAEWVEGVPEVSRWTGAKIKSRRLLPIATYRCERCFYLENYAPPPPIS